MKPYVVDELNNLEDLFCAIIGGRPESLEEIGDFLLKNPLNRLLSKQDIEKLVKYDAYFAPEVVDAIYALLPVEIRLKNESVILYPVKLRELNAETATHAGSRVIDISFMQALDVYNSSFEAKVNTVLKWRAEIKQELLRKKNREEEIQQRQEESDKKWEEKRLKYQAQREQNAKIWHKQQDKTEKDKSKQQEIRQQKEAEKKKRFAERAKKKAECSKITTLKEQEKIEKEFHQAQKNKKFEERRKKAEKALEIQLQLKKERDSQYDELTDIEKLKLELEREKNKLQRRRYRQMHPEKRKSYVKPMSELTPEEQQARREANRRRNEIYRYKNAKKIGKRAKLRRINMKNENPELVKERDRKNNSRASRKIADRKYYQSHKAEIALKSLQNPKTKIYKQRYKTKKRLEKTGPQILALLQGLINVKSR